MAQGEKRTAAEVKAKLAERQARWMRERQAEADKRGVVQEMARERVPPPATSVAPAPARVEAAAVARPDRLGSVPTERAHVQVAASTDRGVAAFDPEEVISRLTERLTDRLRVELRDEVEREHRAAHVAKQLAEMNERTVLEGVLMREIESHTCAVCYELMVAPQRTPVLLFPCGHTFCQACLDQHLRVHGKNACPFCRKPVQSRAHNIALQQLIQAFVAKRERAREAGDDPAAVSWPGGVGASGGAAPGDLASAAAAAGLAPAGASPQKPAGPHDRDRDEYLRRRDQVLVRCRVLANELEDTLHKASAIEPRVARGVAAVEDAEECVARAHAELARAQAALERAQAAVVERKSGLEALRAEHENEMQKAELIERTLEPLRAEAEKLACLAEACGP
ncbi:unnamed protein product [Pedinophyceae sp. YPF-701]|nr:unnamed protein product [Pedinophyceae sp. YPF-701]